MIRQLAFRTLAVAAVLAVLAVPASAQYFGASFGGRFGHHGHGSFGIAFGSPYYYRPAYPVYVSRVWVPGHYETVANQVWVPGCTRRVWVDPVYNDVCDPAGRTTRVCVRNGYWTEVQDPGRYETRYTQVWVEGCYR